MHPRTPLTLQALFRTNPRVCQILITRHADQVSHTQRGTLSPRRKIAYRAAVEAVTRNAPGDLWNAMTVLERAGFEVLVVS
jgi:hypothetical protein